MFNSLFAKFLTFYFIFTIYLSVICHTVVNASDVSLRQQESSPKIIIEQNKSEESLQNSNQSRTITISDEKNVSPETFHNITTDHNKFVIEDQFTNSTARLPSSWSEIKEGALERTGYVALGFMSIVLIFFVVRAVRLRQKRSKSRKYGIITSTVSDMEMEPLDRDDDEEEDATIFDAQHKYSLQ